MILGVLGARRMSSIWGKNIKVCIFGESHGDAIGVTIDNLPAGKRLDLERINIHMKRRSPGQGEFSSSRRESDKPKIISGFLNGYTTGTPLCALIENNNVHSKDYENILSIIRPSHADYPGNIKYKGYGDVRGGGHFSGRLTAAMTFAGAVCMQILNEHGIKVVGHIKSIGNVCDEDLCSINNINKELYDRLTLDKFPVINEDIRKHMQKEILEAKKEYDSIGGQIECGIYGLRPGVGSPMFEGMESVISSIMFSIPAVKGVEFGSGFDIAKMRGSQANDVFYIENDEIKTKTNHNGGILGGLSFGMPIIFNVAIKPTPSIGKSQLSVDIKKRENTVLKIEGRHDPCIVSRATPIIESAAAIAILDLLAGENNL